MLSSRDTIEQLRLHWRGKADEAYSPATHMRIERDFSELEIRPPGMPPNAVLLIRSIRDMIPLTGIDFIPAEWAAELRQRVAACYQHAVRPVRGHFPSGAESVIFLDYAEALSGLTQAIIERRFWTEWCWAQFIPAGQYTPGDALAAAWSRYSRYLPAAFSQLTLGQLYTAVQELRPSSVEAIIRELRSVFALPDMPTRINPPDSDVTSQELKATPTEAPWAVLLPAPPFGLSQRAHYLLGLTRALHRAPAYARSEAFTAQTAQWLETPHIPPDQPRRLIITTRPKAETRPSERSGAAYEEEAPVETPAMGDENGADFTADSISELPVISTDGVWTRYGGVLYLVNLLDWLYLPQDWDAALTQHLTTWALLELLARGLLPDDAVDADDAIWNILAALDNRDSDTLIGVDFPLQDIFHLPARLLQRYAPENPHWHAAVVEGKVRLLDDVHLYLIAEAPLDGREPVALIEALVESYRAEGVQVTWDFGNDQPDEVLTAFAQQAVSPALQHWLRRALGFVRYWLSQIADLSPLNMLQANGRVLVSHTHIDLFLPMDATNIHVRQAGLDRNPGWVPDFGYIILFHFDD